MLQPADTPKPSSYDSDHPWHRQPFDTDEEWQLFCTYIQMPLPRSVPLLAKRIGVDPEELRLIAKRNLWDDRCTAWVNQLHKDYLDNIQIVVIEEARKHGDEYAGALRMMHEIWEREVEKLLKQVRESNYSVLKPRDLLKFMTEYVRTRQLLEGFATDRVEFAQIEQYLDENQFTYEQLKALKAVQEVVAKTKQLGATKKDG